jgi:hypothetical protein
VPHISASCRLSDYADAAVGDPFRARQHDETDVVNAA